MVLFPYVSLLFIAMAHHTSAVLSLFLWLWVLFVVSSVVLVAEAKNRTILETTTQDTTVQSPGALYVLGSFGLVLVSLVAAYFSASQWSAITRAVYTEEHPGRLSAVPM